jgi:hypothetical protein
MRTGRLPCSRRYICLEERVASAIEVRVVEQIAHAELKVPPTSGPGGKRTSEGQLSFQPTSVEMFPLTDGAVVLSFSSRQQRLRGQRR